MTLKPNDGPTLLRLGDLELTLDHPQAAKGDFTRALAQQAHSAPALIGLGKIALLERHYVAALKYFHQALVREPQASSIHYQLSMAYRGLGDPVHMQEQLQARSDVEPVIHDPLLEEIDVLRQGAVGLLDRGNMAMRAKGKCGGGGAPFDVIRAKWNRRRRFEVVCRADVSMD